MKKKSSLLILSLAALLGLAACSGSEADSTSSGSGTDPDPGTSSSNSVVSDYKITIFNPAGVLITSDKERAATGETVNLTITVSAGYTLVEITINDTPINIVGNTASFTMPGRDVTIRGSSTIDAESGEITVGGSATAKLEKEGDLFVARDVALEDDGTVYIAVHGEDSFTPLGWDHYSQNRSFGVIGFGDRVSEYTFPDGADISTNPRESLLTLGGGASYDIYYDPADSDYPIYIQRSKVDLPTTADMLRDVFADVGVSTASYHPDGVTSVTYTDSRLDHDYAWKRYSNSAQAVISDDSDPDNVKTYNIYKAYDADNARVTVVDDYPMGNYYVKSPYPYASGTRNDYINSERREDTSAYSERRIVTEGEVAYEDSDKAIKISKADAESLVKEYEHDIKDIDFAIHYGYRTGFTIEEDLVAANAVVTSEATDNGFSVNVSSYKTYSPSSSGSTYASMSEDVHIEYEMTLTFTEAGAPLTGLYRELYFNSSSYDFSTGTKTGEGTLVKRVAYEYKYDEEITGEAPLDPTPYFATSVSAQINGVNGTNKVQGGWRSDLDDEPLVISVLPETALDAGQFAITASTNEDIIGKSDSYSGYEAGSVAGSTTLTISNRVTGTPSVNIDVEVVKTPFKGLYINIPETDIHSAGRSDSLNLYSNETYTTRLYNYGEDTNGGSLGDFSDITVASSNPDLVTATVDPVERTITFVTGKATVQTSVTLTLNSDNYLDDWPVSTLTATVVPTENPNYTDEDIVGNWSFIDNPGDNLLTFNNDHFGIFAFSDTYDDGSTIAGNVTFTWAFDQNTGFTITDEEVTFNAGQGATADYWNFDIERVQSEDGSLNIGVLLYGETYDWENETTTVYMIYGDYDETNEEYLYIPMEKLLA